MTLDELIAKFPKAKRQPDGSFLVKCVAHQDKNPSLHISQKDDTILMKCHAGCSTESVCQSLGIEMSDIFIEDHTAAPAIPPPASHPAQPAAPRGRSAQDPPAKS